MNAAVGAFLSKPLDAATSRPLRALWHLAHDDWTAAHEAAQVGEDSESCWVHALLHRAEGDQANAAYWYRRAGKPVFKGCLEDEREQMTATLLG